MRITELAPAELQELFERSDTNTCRIYPDTRRIHSVLCGTQGVSPCRVVPVPPPRVVPR